MDFLKKEPLKMIRISTRNSKNLLILGNGFDLACGMPSKIKDYLDKVISEEKYKGLKTAKNYFDNSFHSINYLLNFPGDQKEMNIWIAALYTLASFNETFQSCINWCDLENIIALSLGCFDNKTEYDYLAKSYDFRWKDVYSFLKAKYVNNNSNNWNLPTNTIFVANLLYNQFIEKYPFSNYYSQQLTNILSSPQFFYNYLYEELNRLEHDFKQYLNKNQSSEFNSKALSLINRLIYLKNEENWITTFNYTESTDIISRDRLYIRHIHGCEYPIFGIDASLVPPNDTRIIFTKLYRKIYESANNRFDTYQKEFDNILIFGHSLNLQDRHFFFNLFDQMNIKSANSKGKIVIYYSVYDKTKEIEIKAERTDAVFNLLNAYSSTIKDYSSTAIIENLINTGRLLFVNIDDIPNYE